MEVTALHVYPIKSCRGLSLPSVDVVRRGPAHDRSWMLVDDAGRFVTARDVPELVLVETAIDGDRLVVRRSGAPGAGELAFPAEPAGGERVLVEVWRHRGEAIVDRAASAWFSAALGRSLRAVYLPPDVERGVNPAFGRPGDRVAFTDGYPCLVVSEESLADLSARAGVPLVMARFRPNVVVRGATPYAEDDWRRLRIGALDFRVAKPCERCSITLVDPTTADRGVEPLRTLATYRKRGDEVTFGAYLLHDGTGTLRVGDPVVAA